MNPPPFIAILNLAIVFVCTTTIDASADGPYLQEVKPLLKEKCFACHGALKQKAGLHLDTAKLIKKGCVHGTTDELGFHALDLGHYATDLHVTALHLLRLDPRKLEVPERKRFDIDHGEVMHDILT